MRKKITLWLSLICFINLNEALAQVVVLTCKAPITAEFKEKLEQSAQSSEALCAKRPQIPITCDVAKRNREQVTKCEQSGLTYSHKREYTFDKKSLNDKNESWAEFSNETCWGTEQKSRQRINATPSLITFEDDLYPFNVERDTLNAGVKQSRGFECEIKEKVLKNKI
jgi:hypothetical protein